MLETIIVIAVLVLIIGSAVTYIIKEKKSGTKCIGCPHSKECSSNKNGGCSCGKQTSFHTYIINTPEIRALS